MFDGVDTSRPWRGPGATPQGAGPGGIAHEVPGAARKPRNWGVCSQSASVSRSTISPVEPTPTSSSAAATMSSHVTAVANATEGRAAPSPLQPGHHGADRARGGEAPGQHDISQREGGRAQVERDEDPGRVVDAWSKETICPRSS